MAFLQYLRKIRWPAQAVGVAAVLYQRGQASAMRILRSLDQEVDSRPEGEMGEGGEISSKTEPPELSVSNLIFTFSGESTPLFQGVSFSITPGERVAILGDVGSGKSTLAGILAGLVPIDSGEVRIGAQAVSGMSRQELKKRIALVTQEPILFHTSVAENLSPGRMPQDEEETSRVFEEVCHTAAIHEEIKDLEEGYHTVLGERGIRLSGGQRQRLSIARALYQGAEVVVFDDALSAVDVATEATILERLSARPRTTTEIYITHRLSTALAADRIIVVDQGRVRITGTHEELLASGDTWYEGFCQRQNSEGGAYAHSR